MENIERYENPTSPLGRVPVLVVGPQESQRAPGIVLIHEAFGVTDYIKGVARQLANSGYVVAVPDLLHRCPRNVVAYADKDVAIAQLRGLSRSDIWNDVDAALNVLSATPTIDGTRLAVLGFCLGGRVAFEAAYRHPELVAAVTFYGGGIVAPGDPDEPIANASSVAVPWLGLFGDADESIPAASLEVIRREMTSAGADFRIEVFEGAGHAFHCDARPTYHHAAAERGWTMATEFLGARCALTVAE